MFQVHLGEAVKIVCHEGFASLHGVGVKRIRRLCSLKAEARIPVDMRGRHRNRFNAKSDEIYSLIDDHINSFPYKVEHYTKSGNKKRYLSGELSVLKMYELFLEKHRPEHYQHVNSGTNIKTIDCDVKYSFYLDYYRRNYNYKFGRPRTDVCVTCARLSAKIETEENPTLLKNYKTELDVHKTRAKSFYTKLTNVINDVANDEEKELLCFDFKQNMPIPHLPTSDVFYSRQMWVYVMSVYSGTTKKKYHVLLARNRSENRGK